MPVVYVSSGNPKQNRFTPGAATWKLLGTNGTCYASLAAAQAASTTAWPGVACQSWMLVGEAAGGGALSVGCIHVHLGGASAPGDDTTSTPMFPGTYLGGDGPVQPIWVRCETATDLVSAMAQY